MSTSPSWFDQEKFSRLVKKVGPKTVTEPLPSPHGADPENRPVSGEGLASTARISLVSKPPSLLTEHRALPALPRRTAPLPTLKALFPSSTSPDPSPSGQPPTEESGPGTSTETFSGGEEVKPDPGVMTDPLRDGDAPVAHEGEDLAAVWQKMSLLNEELAHTIQERDQAVHEGALLREQLHQAQEAGKEPKPANLAETQQITIVTDERDQARREYAKLREEFETLKQGQNPKEESGKVRKELEQQLEGFSQKLEERNREIAALKANSGGPGDGDEKLKQEITSLREQLTRAKEEASISQRGLALSQKALQETRATLREATEGTSLSRHNFDNLKNECAILAQQNTVLQAQNDQLARELGATKSKLTTRL